MDTVFWDMKPSSSYLPNQTTRHLSQKTTRLSFTMRTCYRQYWTLRTDHAAVASSVRAIQVMCVEKGTESGESLRRSRSCCLRPVSPYTWKGRVPFCLFNSLVPWYTGIPQLTWQLYFLKFCHCFGVMASIFHWK